MSVSLRWSEEPFGARIYKHVAPNGADTVLQTGITKLSGRRHSLFFIQYISRIVKSDLDRSVMST